MNLITQSIYNLHTGQTRLQPRHQQNQQQMAGTDRRKTSTQEMQKHDNLGLIGKYTDK